MSNMMSVNDDTNNTDPSLMVGTTSTSRTIPMNGSTTPSLPRRLFSIGSLQPRQYYQNYYYNFSSPRRRVRRHQRLSQRKVILVTLWTIFGIWSYGFVTWVVLVDVDKRVLPTSSSSKVTMDNLFLNHPLVVVESTTTTTDAVSSGTQIDSLRNDIPRRRQQEQGERPGDGSVLPMRETVSTAETKEGKERYLTEDPKLKTVQSRGRWHKQSTGGREQGYSAYLRGDDFELWIVFPILLFLIVALESRYSHRGRGATMGGVGIMDYYHSYSTLMTGRRGMDSYLASLFRAPSHQPDSIHPPATTTTNNGEHQPMESMLRTLGAINEDRIALGESTISIHSYMALQQVLNDRTIWMGLAERYQLLSELGGRGSSTTTTTMTIPLTRDQIEQTCPEWTVQAFVRDDTDRGGGSDHTSHNPGRPRAVPYGSECSICLADYEVNDTVRTLPCGHIHHTRCIDRWLEQSALCPICKQSIECRTGGHS